MQEKDEPENELRAFESLSPELVNKIGRFLKKDRVAGNSFVETCSLFYNYSQGERLRTSLSGYIINGNQVKAKEILDMYPHLMLERGTIKDRSGRLFRNITVWEYILWALDVRYMGKMILDCLPLNEEGDRMAKKLLVLFNRVEAKGISFELNGHHYLQQHHYDFFIIQALSYFIDNYKQWDLKQRTKIWCQVVGMAQFELPAHIAQHYCDPSIPFYPLPKFDAETFNRTLMFRKNYTEKYFCWWCGVASVEHRLGINIAIYRKSSPRMAVGISESFELTYGVLRNNVQALTGLRDQRMADSDMLKKNLLERIQQNSGQRVALYP